MASTRSSGSETDSISPTFRRGNREASTPERPASRTCRKLYVKSWLHQPIGRFLNSAPIRFPSSPPLGNSSLLRGNVVPRDARCRPKGRSLRSPFCRHRVSFRQAGQPVRRIAARFVEDALEIGGEFGTMTRFGKRLTATWVAMDKRHLKQARYRKHSPCCRWEKGWV